MVWMDQEMYIITIVLSVGKYEKLTDNPTIKGYLWGQPFIALPISHAVDFLSRNNKVGVREQIELGDFEWRVAAQNYIISSL